MANLTITQLKSIQGGRSLKSKFVAMHTLGLERKNISQVLKSSEEKGGADLDVTSKAILLRSQNGDFEEAFELAKWSVKAKPQSRKVVVRSFLKNKRASLLVHHVARMKRADASGMMKDYFSEGGNIKDVAEWLSVAGNILKTGVIPDDTDGVWGWVKDTVGGVVDAVVGAINTVADAIKEAGKNLAEAVSAVSSWSQSKISDFVEAIIRAGKTVAEIMNEAVKKGTAVIQKFIQAVIEAGKKGIEVLNWAVAKAENVLKTALTKLEQLLGSFTTLLFEIAKMASSRLFAVVKALLSAGKAVLDFVSRLDRIAYNIAKQIVQEIKRVGRTIREIINAVLNKSRYIARIVLDALRSLGNSIRSILNEVVTRTINQISILIGALKDLATSLSQILDEVAKFALTQAKKLMSALRLIWTRVKEILEFIARKSESVIRTLIAAFMGTLIHIREVLQTILVEIRAAFRKGLIKGLIQIGKSAVTLMVETLKISASVAAVLFAIIMDIFGSHRGLNAEERAEAEKVFGISIDLDQVQLTTASFPADFIMWLNKNRPFTTMYVINYKSGTTLPMNTLIHELTHVWQAVNSGGVYMLEALHSQFFGKGYNLTEADVRNANGKLLNLEREQQAVLVEDYWRAKFNEENIPIPLDVIEPLAKQAYKAKFNFNTFNLKDFEFVTRPMFILNN